MSASISFPALTDENILWQNRDAATAFFAALSVADATISEEGVVKQAVAVSFSFIALVNTDVVTITQDDGVTTVSVPKKESYDELKASYIVLQTAFNQLLTNLRAAGILES